MARFSLTVLALLSGAGLATLPAQQAADTAGFLQNQVFAKPQWRNLGPATFGGRIVDLDVNPEAKSTWYVAVASSGVWKTTNNGVSFQPIFDDQPAFSIGDLAVSPSKPDVVYVGTGEANNQRSSYWGNGVYKTTDAGKTWSHLGLERTEHIGRIAVHPTNADIVFVAALGALYTPNDDRGLYRSLDGGATWKCVKHISADVGFVDVAIDPKRPDTIYAASYERRRRPHHLDESGPGSRLWQSTDGGETWTRLEGGLPGGELGRIGLAIYPRNSDIVYALVENFNAATPAPKKPDVDQNGTDDRQPRRPLDALPGDDEPPASAPDEEPRRRTVGGEIWRSDNAGKSWKKINDKPIGGSPPYYYGQIRVDPQDDQRLYVLSVPVHTTTDGGKTWSTDFARGLHVDHHALWIDPANPARCLLGNDGGLAITHDRGKHWDWLNHLPIAQFYAIGVDLRDPYWIYGGTQDNGTWRVPSCGATTQGATNLDARRVNGGDGFFVAVDPTDADTVYSESQFGALSRLDLRTGQSRSIRPRAERGQSRLRANWSAPLLLSPHNPRTLYFGTQYVHRSRDRGDHWEAVSPDLTTSDPDKLKGNVPHCTLTALAESPRREGWLWAGTDDGKVWTSRNGGERWTDLSDRFPGLPKPLWVSRIETSPTHADVAYVAFTGYREDLRTPYLYVTTDGGETFRSIAQGLPVAPVNVIREHPRNANVLLVGTESGVHVSVDAGGSWYRLGRGLPNATPVHDLLIHPRERDVVIGTHGRGLWVLDATMLEDLNDDLLEQPLVVFAPRDGRTLPRAFGNGYTGARGWRAQNPQLGATFRYYLSEESADAVKLSVRDATDRELFDHNGEKAAGVHEVVWNPRGGSGMPGFGGGRSRGGSSQGPGQYLLRITHGETVIEKPFWIRSHDAGRSLRAADEELVEQAQDEDQGW